MQIFNSRIIYWLLINSSAGGTAFLINASASDILLGLFSFLLFYSVSVLTEHKVSRNRMILLSFAAFIIAFPFYLIKESLNIQIIAISFPILQFLLNFAILYLSFFILHKHSNLITGQKNRIAYKRITRFLLFSYPFLLIETGPFIENRFPIGFGIYPLFYLITNILILQFISRFIYFPKMSLQTNTEAANEYAVLYSLTKREEEISQRIVNGETYREIAEAMFISLETVKTHMNNIYRKVNVRNKVELINAFKKT